jgi:hypothetical protein
LHMFQNQTPAILNLMLPKEEHVYAPPRFYIAPLTVHYAFSQVVVLVVVCWHPLRLIVLVDVVVVVQI